MLLLTVGVAALGLAAIPAAGCHGSAPSLLLRVEDPSNVGPNQLKVTVVRDGADPRTVVRPEAPAGPLASGQTLRLHLPLETIGARVSIQVEGLTGAVVTAEAEGAIEITDGGETELRVTLEPVECSPETCPSGCCHEGVCVPAEGDACDVVNVCASCDPHRSDACVSDECRCGEGPACSSGELCVEGACVVGQACELDEDCGPLPEGGCVENTGVCLEGVCETAPKDIGTVCDDGLRCTEGEVCDGEGSCGSGTEVVCEPGSNPCLIYNEVCSALSGCSRPVLNGSICSSPNACAISTCTDGACLPSGPACAPGQFCCPDHPHQLCFDSDPGGHICLTTPT